MPTLEMRCPSCKRQAAMTVEKTERNFFHMNSWHSAHFEAVHGLKFLYRRRQRRCAHCRTRRTTAEVDFEVLRGLVDETTWLRSVAAIDWSTGVVAPNYVGITTLIADVFSESASAIVPFEQLTIKIFNECVERLGAVMSETSDSIRESAIYLYCLPGFTVDQPEDFESKSAVLRELRENHLESLMPIRTEFLRTR